MDITEENSCEFDHDDEAPGLCLTNKIVYSTIEDANAGAQSLKENGSPDAYGYECAVGLTCMMCYANIPGPAHYHVASSPVPRRLRAMVLQSDGTPHRS